jgi:hypothetical protein
LIQNRVYNGDDVAGTVITRAIIWRFVMLEGELGREWLKVGNAQIKDEINAFMAKPEN